MTPTEQAAYDFVTGLIHLIYATPFLPQILLVFLVLAFLSWAVRQSRGPSVQDDIDASLQAIQQQRQNLSYSRGKLRAQRSVNRWNRRQGP